MPVGTRIGGRLALLCVAPAALACATQRDVVTRVFREQFHCSDPQVRELRDGLWEAQGCGNLRHYSCRTDDSLAEPKLMCWGIPDEPMAIALVHDLHGRTYGCNATDVRPLETRPRIYQARGCGQQSLYDCWTNAYELYCKERPRIPDEPMFVALVQGLHGRTYGCNATDVRPLEGSPNIYQARGCGPSILYECWAEANQAFCKPR